MADTGPRPPGAAPRLSWGATLALVALVAFVSVVSALIVHSACTDPGPPVSRPEPGTARAGYCATADDGVLRAVIVTAAVVAVALAAAPLRRRPWWAVIVTAVVVLASAQRCCADGCPA
jgi:hypothetical protein